MEASDAQILCTEIVSLINEHAQSKQMNCGEIIEVLCNVNASICSWLGEALDVDAMEVMSDVYSIVLDNVKIEDKEREKSSE